MIPNPGSEAACALGCFCLLYINDYGRGTLGSADDPQGPLFQIGEDCPLHDTKGWREQNGRTDTKV